MEMFLGLLLLLCRVQLGLSQCCTKKVVDSGTGDSRDGTYHYNTSRFDLPAFCGDECVYIKEGASPEDLYCFGVGELDSVCYAPIDAETPPALPILPGGGTDTEDEGLEPGEYVENRLPGDNVDALLCGDIIGIVNEDRMSRLDLAAMATLVPTSVSPARKLRFERIDDVSSGQVHYDHLVGIFETLSTGGQIRLQIAGLTGVSTDTATTRLTVKNGDGTACSGGVMYGQEYGVFSEDGVNMLDIGTVGTGSSLTFWDEANAETRLHLNKLT